MWAWVVTSVTRSPPVFPAIVTPHIRVCAARYFLRKTDANVR